jgi:uncharacterized protein (DUF362 family)
VRLGKILMPDVAVIDAFEGMEGDGPICGMPVELHLAIAGVDPIACDAVGAFLMGFDPLSIGYLALAHETRMGTADMENIEVVGENPHSSRKMFRRHLNDPLHARWREAW